MTSNTQIRFNLKWDFGKTSFRGRTYADVKAVPALSQWILSRPEPTGQMADLVAYLQRTNEALEKPSSATATDMSRVVYRIPTDGSTERALVDIDEMTELVESHGKDHAMAGGLRCELGHPMKFTRAYEKKDGTVVCAHFSHIGKSSYAKATDCDEDKQDAKGGSGNGRGCSDVHLLAIKLLMKNVHRIQLKRFRKCGECVEFAFGPNPNAVAKEEISAYNDDGGRIRSDVAVYDGDQKVMTLEVRKTHKTDPASRAGVPYLEINAGHVIAMLNASQVPTSTATIRLNCENVDEPCVNQCVERRELDRARYIDKKRKAWRENENARKDCFLCNGTSGIYRPCMLCRPEDSNIDLCDFCDGTGSMYACDDIYIPCVYCNMDD